MHPLCVRHDHFVSQRSQQPAYPGGMCSCLQCDATPRYPRKCLLHRLRCRRQFLFQNDLACFISNAVERISVGMATTSWRYSAPIGRPSKTSRAANTLLAAWNPTGPFSSGLAICKACCCDDRCGLVESAPVLRYAPPFSGFQLRGTAPHRSFPSNQAVPFFNALLL